MIVRLQDGPKTNFDAHENGKVFELQTLGFWFRGHAVDYNY
jgi:hypothetical protein